ncbi:mediator of RNA polymerase II transcription subunit 13-like isoform X2 [Limulus polyphemus]|uniref:Mediator of RNA polymerase II transcription subunit 13 n=1 Tax=Limulus polyphemus TaxID=6850 RepID=A0ABM1T908_LIMPO|nr:mediator of RNA polymerase II transcription subunit 13-like isoform X2 [Limulus polyphemus]
MTNPNFVSNGVSLEDSHTNFFALTDLCGIKWRCLCANRVLCYDSELLDDPVITSYKVDQGSLENGLSYECRTLLFKAFHNLIERCFLSRGFTRLGKWFIQPLESLDCLVILSPYGLAGTLTGQTYKQNDPGIQQLLVEWQQFYPLNKTETTGSDDMPCLVEVKVAGVKMKYPSCYVFVTENDEKMMTNLSSGGGTIAPSVITLAPQSSQKPNGHMNVLTPPTSPYNTCLASSLQCSRYVETAMPGLLNNQSGHQISSFPDEVCSLTTHRLKSDTRQDNIIHHHPPFTENSEPDDSLSFLQWEFNDPRTQIDCFCMRSRSKRCSSGGNRVSCGVGANSSCSSPLNHGIASNSIAEKERGQQRTRGTVPFHKRSHVSSHSLVANIDSPATLRAPPVPGLAGANSRYLFVQKCVGLMGNSSNTLQHLQTLTGQPMSVESSHPGTPLLLEGALSQPSSTDPAMPTLSPHPPGVKEDPEMRKEGLHSQNPAVFSSCNTTKEKYLVDQVLSPYQNLPMTPEHHKICEGSHRVSTFSGYWPANDQKQAQLIHSNTSIYTKVSNQGIKRPVLSTLKEEEIMEEESFHRTKCLYDYSSLHSTSWEPEQKKRKHFNCGFGVRTESILGDLEETLNSSKSKDPYEFNDDFEDEQRSSSPGGSSYRSCIDMFIKEGEKTREQEVTPPPAPYPGELSKPSVLNELSCATSPLTPRPHITSFTREEDLQLTEHDLENIFEVSASDESSNEMFQHPATPNSIKFTPYEENVTNANSTSFLGPAELMRMFPTPPSLEPHVTPSPSGIVDITVVDGNNGLPTIRERLDNHASFDTSGLYEQTRDWSYVYKPMAQYKFLSSNKYSPLSSLPSNTLPSLSVPPETTYKPYWHFYFSSQAGMLATSAGVPDNHFNGYHLPPFSPSESYSPDLYQKSLPIIYDLQSPASNASSYLNKHLGSIDNSLSSTTPEAHSLVVNLILSDSMLNLFKDHNFSSCTLCVCNMNVKGTDIGLYLPDSMVAYKNNELQEKCTCGFSAVVNRHLGYNSGLFYEDEVDLTGLQKEPINRHHQRLKTNETVSGGGTSSTSPEQLLNKMSHDVPALLQSHCSVLQPSASWLFFARQLGMESQTAVCNTLQVLDGCEVCYLALEAGRQALDSENTVRLENKCDYLHKWPYLPAKLPASNYDIVRLFKVIQPLLQVAVQKKTMQGIWEVTYTVSGPLTWRQFHRLAGRVGASTEDQCEPQPIPTLLVGYDKDCLAVSPFALKLWDKLLLEPFSLPQDIAYVVVAPDNDFILSRVRSFFKELSSVYELCHLGHHSPITKVLRDGIMRVGKSAARKLADEPVDEWFNFISNGPVASKLKLYAQVCRHHLAPYLASQSLDKSLFSCLSSVSSKLQSEAPLLSSLHMDNHQEKEHTSKLHDSDSQQEFAASSGGYNTNSLSETWEQDNGQQPPALVVYIIEPFTYGDPDRDLYRLATLGLLLCYNQMLRYLPEHIRNSIHVQIIRLDCVLSMGKAENFSQYQNELKALAFSVFSQCRRLLNHPSRIKSLTGFGPSAVQERFLNVKQMKNRIPRTLFCPPFILATTKDKQIELGEMFGDCQEKSSVLYCCYCPTEDHRWLLACCINEKGDILENCCINIDIPDRTHRRKASSRTIGLHKLLDFVLSVMSSSCSQWRLVVGRLGRIGHGELKDWASLLGRKSLLRYTRQLRQLCSQCAVLSAVDIPCILSACLVSLEPDSSFRIMPDQCTSDNRFGSSSHGCELSTPEDASCTHILVYPTSATSQSSQATFQQEHIDPLADDDFLRTLDITEEQDISDLIGLADTLTHSPIGSPRRDCGSPGGRHSPFHHNGPVKSLGSVTGDHQEEPLQLLQQPLALGYYVSTAKTGPLPRWFWSSCPHLKDACPVFLKSALHIHSPTVQQNSDELLHTNQHVRNCHPLDSNLTTDVLRYVLEGYNALSWLSFDSATNDRQSCLPLHIQILMQQYHAAEAIL